MTTGQEETEGERTLDTGLGTDMTVLQQRTSQNGYGTLTSVSSHREQAVITALHAAAVNGDKSSLSKLLHSSMLLELDSGDKFGRTPLMYAILCDRLDCAEMLVKAGSDINRADKGGRTALHWAAHKGNAKCIKMLLSKGANWKTKDHEGQAPMHLVTHHKSARCLTLILRQLEPGEVDDQDRYKRTALHWAASHGNLEHVRLLIKQDSNVGIPDVEGKTPLHHAACSKDSEAAGCVQLILQSAPSVISWQDYEGRTALHLAVADGNTQIVRTLISLERCNVSALDNMFRTPLHWGAVLGHTEISEILLQAGADFLSSDANGATPLHYCAQNNFYETVACFLRHPGMRDEPDNEGRTAFMWAAGKGADQVLRVFIEKKVDMALADKTGGTALHAAALSGHSSTVELLLAHGADLSLTDLQKHTPLFRACEMGHTDVAETLINHDAQFDITDQDGRSPLHWAALGGHANICQTLITFGVDPNIQDTSGRTPLQCAAYGGFVNCMSILVENNAKVNTQDNEGMTALHWACSKGHFDAVKFLTEFHAFPNHMEYAEDRYTPLDYALIGEHSEVAQYMVEQGALSITGIQDIAALKIQAVFRGFRVRKASVNRMQLLMKHEQLRKDAAKKKAEQVEKRREENSESTRESSAADLNSETKSPDDVSAPQVAAPSDPGPSLSSESSDKFHHQSKETPSGGGTRTKKSRRGLMNSERQRLKETRRKEWAANVIQDWWRKKAAHTARLDADDSHRPQNSRTINDSSKVRSVEGQLAHDSNVEDKEDLSPSEKSLCAGKSLQSSPSPRDHQNSKSPPKKNDSYCSETVHPEKSAKQRPKKSQSSSSDPKVSPPGSVRRSPTNTLELRRSPASDTSRSKSPPSPAVSSYNFAVQQYFPHSGLAQDIRNSWKSQDSPHSSAEDFGKLSLVESSQRHHFSYNLT